jgi:hypothetical protein
MLIRQEETTPIGDTFHDSGILKIMEKLQNVVDEFEVETDDVQNYCDNLITSLKNLKAVTKKAETEYAKVKAQKELKASLNTYN